ncbi:MAG: hypothetical protein H0U58_07855, partial [Chloroflexi bacterium]|nr:hypothetical protein [Chloroflexota bacterium]
MPSIGDLANNLAGALYSARIVVGIASLALIAGLALLRVSRVAGHRVTPADPHAQTVLQRFPAVDTWHLFRVVVGTST